jgi:hypothetical protein
MLMTLYHRVLEEEYKRLLLHFWTPLLAYALLLGVLLLIMGIGLAGLASAVKSAAPNRLKRNDTV